MNREYFIYSCPLEENDEMIEEMMKTIKSNSKMTAAITDQEF